MRIPHCPKSLLSLCLGLAALLLGACTATKVTVPDTIIVADGKSGFEIVLPDDAGNPNINRYLRQGATALQSAFLEGTEVSLPIVAESKRTPGKRAICIGNCRATQAAGLKPAQCKNYDFFIAERNGDIFLAGNDAPASNPKLVPFRFYYLGSVKSTVAFMEKFLGTKILLPGETGRSTPKRGCISVPANLTLKISPLLRMATSAQYEMIYSMSNNDFGIAGFSLYGGHSYYSAVPAKVYGETHPEYFALRGNKRISTGNHLCISNPEVQELIYLEAKKRLEAGAEVVELAQTDGYSPCQCEPCKNLFGVSDEGEKLWILHRNIAARLYREMPDKKVLIICYGPTWQPPKTFNRFPPNTMIELCAYSPSDLEAWSKITVPQGYTSYVYHWGSYKLPGFTPMHSPEFLAGEVQRFARFGIKGVYRCGFGASFGLEGPAYYVYGKMWDDPSQDFRQLEQDFYHAAYGESAAPMVQFFAMLHDRLRPFDKLDGLRTTLPRNPRAYLGFVYTPELLMTMDKHLTRAEKLAVNAKVKRRLHLVRLEFDYLKNLAEIVHLYHAYRISPDRNSFETLAQRVEARNQMIDSYFDDKGKKKPLPDWPELSFRGGSTTKADLLRNGELAAPLGAPYAWNIPLLRENGVLPGKLMQRVTVCRRNDGALDDFNAGAWEKVPATELSGIQLGSLKLGTSFKMLYDDENIYVAFKAALPASRTYLPQGHDGGATGQDCLEFFVDPYGEREIYYHLIWNPVAKSTYDSARGLIKDALNPLFNKFDPSWNGEWSYTTSRDGDNWYSVLTLPLATISAEPPTPGTVWCLNVGRTDYNDGKGMPELSLWSPNLETMSFHDPECFGEAVFQ